MTTPTTELVHPSDTTTRALLAAVVVLLGVQVVHVAEHLAQVTAWLANPGDSAFLTPIAVAGRDALAPAAAGNPVGGVELLHLFGNVAFLVGLAALHVYLVRLGRPRPTALRLAIAVQAGHVAEHLLLTATWYATGEPMGLTTALGALEGTTAVGTRVLAHALLNLVPAGLTVAALHQLRVRES